MSSMSSSNCTLPPLRATSSGRRSGPTSGSVGLYSPRRSSSMLRQRRPGFIAMPRRSAFCTPGEMSTPSSLGGTSSSSSVLPSDCGGITPVRQ